MNLQHLPPGSLMMLGAFLVPLIPRKFQAWYALILPILSAVHLLTYFSNGFVFDATFMGYALQPIRVDKLSLIFFWQRITRITFCS